MKDLTIINYNGVNVTDSREVAEMTGKEHKNLIRDIRNYVEVLQGSKLSSENFFIESEYLNSRNQKQPCYLLTKQGCEMVANKMTGEKGILFTAEYVTAFNKMEDYIRDGIETGTTAKPILELQCLDVTSKLLRFNDNSKLLGVRKIYDKYGMEKSFLPEYTESKGILKSITELLKEFKVNMSAIKFNKILVDKGILEEKTRTSSKDKSKVKKFKSLINLEYGENQVNPKAPKETQPLFYEDKFMDLLKKVGVVED